MVRTLRTRVQGGRIRFDEPVDLPEGTEVEVTVTDAGDDLDDAERARLHAALELAAGELSRGEGIPASEVLERLRAKRTLG